MLSKSVIRKTLRTQRRCLNHQAQRLAAQQLAQQLRQLPAFKRARHIAAYWPNDGEISPLFFLQELQKLGKKLYLPEVLTTGHIRFKNFHFTNCLQKNIFGIPEPVGRQQRAAPDLDIVLVPLVAFDKYGNRLGMGGGYYDKTFAFKKKFLWRKKPLLIGLAHHFQEVVELHNDNWDIPLSIIVTDQSVIRRIIPE